MNDSAYGAGVRLPDSSGAECKASAAVSFESIIKKFKRTDGSEFNALDNVSFDIPSGAFSIIAGKNGSGKSLLMNIAKGLVKADSGNVRIGQGLSIGVVFQNSSESILGDTVLDDVLISLRMKDRNLKNPEAIAGEYLDKVGLLGKKDRFAHSLSSGESRRLLIASVSALDRQIVFFDEPYSNLDYPGVKEINDLLVQMRNGGATIVIITHELEKCLALAQKLIVLDNGKLVYDGVPSDAIGKLEGWGVRNPLSQAAKTSDLVWI